ncbi:transcriptional regulator, GntR family with aminotransferase domain [Paenibacillus curdlanolyticus YK9]|uniref:Transcriptional regulator, GntR family with aminotransferase domain n=1 Tax=Paenibacillus curdlanolyticus YK9 TaxID=717606 RepID=E0I7Q2_9BACL|nr:PLP-dependent aminotransferase family protein [Paenibacillus curdlanolyticus]EFM11207.1 transcriptional regulator, GntR family with aminotransferase domain [Paenibacillus curdlanolyticus YK9]
MEFTPILDRNSEQPLYLQLYRYIRTQMEEGRIDAGSRLPSIRQLSAHLQVSKVTIETAYQQLIAEGYIESRERSGLRALPVEKAPAAIRHESVSRNSSSGDAAAESTSLHANHSKPDRREGRGDLALYDFQYGDIDVERFPMKAWRACLHQALDYDLRGVLNYGHPQGDAELRAALARYLGESRGVHCTAEQIVLSAGTQQSMALLCRLLPLAGQAVAIEEPGYHGVRSVLADHDCALLPIPIEHDGLSITALKASHAAAVYVTPSHQFPIGSVLSAQKRHQLIHWASERGAFILEDDYDSEFRYQGQPIHALQALDQDGRVIYLGTMSKSFLPSIRMSYLVLPPPVAAASQARLASYNTAVSPLLQRAVMLFMREGHMERHVRRMRRLYQAKHRRLIHALQAHMQDRISIIGQKAGLHLLIDVHGRQRDELIALAEAAGVRVYSPAPQWSAPAQCPPSLIMLGFGGVPEEAIEEGIRRLAAAWFN